MEGSNNHSPSNMGGSSETENALSTSSANMERMAQDMVDLKPQMNEARVELIEKTRRCYFGKDNRYTNMGNTFTKIEKLEEVLQENIGMFAWSVVDMTDIDPKLVCHKLFVYKEARPIAHKRRKIGRKKKRATRVDVHKLVKVGFIKEATYTTCGQYCIGQEVQW